MKPCKHVKAHNGAVKTHPGALEGQQISGCGWESHLLDEELDPDPDPRQSKKLDPDPHPHQSYADPAALQNIMLNPPSSTL